MENKNNIDDKVISLYQFLYEYTKIKSKIILNDSLYKWTKKIDSIKTNENIFINYFDSVEKEEETDIPDNEEDNYLLKVVNKDFKACPKLPSNLKRWIENGYDNYKNEVVYIEKHTNYNSKTNLVETELFFDNKERVDSYNEWINKRNVWILEQKEIEIIRNLFTELYNLYTDLKKDSENIELIVTNGYIEDKENLDINHPLLTKRVGMKFDSAANSIYILNSNSKTEMYTELLQSINNISLEDISKLSDELLNNDYHPLDRNNTKQFLKRFIHEISSNSKFYDSDEIEDDIDVRIKMFFKPSFILRKRIDGTLKTLEKIILNIQESGFIPEHLKDIVNGGVVELDPEKEESISEMLANTGGESTDILLTKAANKEQLEIAKKIDKYNAVSVQGPPGTGKTHTIANLVGDFLAKGKSVLVTSYTSKALNVLKEKIPSKIQDLCVSVIDDSNEDMKKSIDGINDYISRYSSFTLQKKIESLKNERINVINELSKTRTDIYNILYSEYRNIVLHGEEISPSDASKFLYDNIGKLDYINGKVDLDAPLPLTEDEFDKLYSYNSELSDEDEKELSYNLPNPDSLITPKNFNSNLNELNELELKIKEIENKTHWSINLNNNDISFETDFGNFYVLDNNVEDVNKLLQFVESNKNCNEWCHNIICDSKRGSSYISRWIRLIDKINNACFIHDTIADKYLGFNYTYSSDDVDKLEKIVKDIKNKFVKSGKISKINMFIHKDISNLLKENIINSRPINSLDDCNFILDYISLIKIRKELSLMWNELFKNTDILHFYELDDEPEYIAQKYINEINYYLKWYEEKYILLKELLKNANIPVDIVLLYKYTDRDIDQVKKIFHSINEILPNIINTCYYRNRINVLTDEINKSVDILDNDLLINSRICIELKKSLNEKLFDKYLEYYRILDRVYNKNNVIKNRTILLNKLREVAPQWANDIENKVGIHGSDKCPEDITGAWKYKQLEGKIKEITSKSLSKLDEDCKKISKEYRDITEKYAEACSWYELLKRVEHDISMQQSLSGWKLTVQKIGKGTGKNAAKYKAKARELMTKCQMAVPCWIMPMNKALESLTPGKNIFDIIIIDEASQSDISSLAIAYFGKKMIVVGDDKQVSPLGIGNDIDKINNISKMYLSKEIPNSHLYTTTTSLYDIASTTFHPLMLKEHFRCVPEIIGFSNMLSYDFKIKPLRDQNSSNLLPSIIDYRVEGKRDVDSKKNLVEAQTIVSLIKACLSLEEYNGKTFGIISLLGEEQVQLIEQLISKYIEIKDREERKILVGISSQFQGDERDIIFLSMVDSGDNSGTPLRMMSNGSDDSNKKRYNVAVSRAKDQLWVVHSLDRDCDLKDNDIRKKLLEYASNPNAFDNLVKIVEKKSESIFEEEVAKKLIANGYKLEQQYPVGAYRLDIVVKCKDKKVVIECDGDSYHSGDDKIRADMERQQILERIGWKFIRIRGTNYFRNPEKEMNNVFEQLNKLGINPENYDFDNCNRSSELLEKVKSLASENYKKISDGEESSNFIDNISYALDDHKQNNLNYNDNNQENKLKNYFRYMVLYCEKINIKEISEYYDVSENYVKQILDDVAKSYNVTSLEDAINGFKTKYDSTDQYKNVRDKYYKDINFNEAYEKFNYNFYYKD